MGDYLKWEDRKTESQTYMIDKKDIYKRNNAIHRGKTKSDK